MKKIKNHHQGDLFGISEPETMRQRVKDLDSLISKSIKKKDFSAAKTMADEQASLIRQLVESDNLSENELV
ncbi:hypothetical protein HQ585_21420 [candidate division KSB1 bacterium]|nr:hypothetical protein [candidate division KSB1 bacterium]